MQRWHRSPEGRLARIELEIRVPEGFPEKYHAALERAAKMCTVKRTMDDPPEFEVRTVTGPGGGARGPALPSL